MTSSFKIIDPHPNEWLTTSRINFIRSKIFPICFLLKDSKILDEIIKLWIVYELKNEEISPAEPHQDALDDTDLMLHWARQKWGHRTESLYLQKKSKLDQITYLLLRVPSRNFATELYYRIKAKEDSFEHLCLKYSTGRERFKGGRIERQSMDIFPDLMQTKLRNLKEGELHQPVKFGSDYAVIQVLEHIPACFDENTADRLLMWEFDDWISGMTKSVRGHLELDH